MKEIKKEDMIYLQENKYNFICLLIIFIIMIISGSIMIYITFASEFIMGISFSIPLCLSFYAYYLCNNRIQESKKEIYGNED